MHACCWKVNKSRKFGQEDNQIDLYGSQHIFIYVCSLSSVPKWLLIIDPQPWFNQRRKNHTWDASYHPTIIAAHLRVMYKILADASVRRSAGNFLLVTNVWLSGVECSNINQSGAGCQVKRTDLSECQPMNVSRIYMHHIYAQGNLKYWWCDSNIIQTWPTIYAPVDDVFRVILLCQMDLFMIIGEITFMFQIARLYAGKCIHRPIAHHPALIFWEKMKTVLRTCIPTSNSKYSAPKI